MKKKAKKKPYMSGVRGALVGAAEGGIKYPGSKAVKTGFRNYLKGVRAGGK